MSDNSFDPIRDRLSRILRDAQPQHGSHLTEQQIIALAGQKPGPGDPLPDHLRSCAWCCRRVFEARRKVALEHARPQRLSLPIDILQKAVQFLKAPPGMQEVYAFSQPARVPLPGRSVRTVFEHRMVQPEIFPSAPPKEADDLPEHLDLVFAREYERVSGMPMEMAVPHPAMTTEAIPLSIEGIDGRLIVTHHGAAFSMTLLVLETGTGKPIPGITLRLKGEGIDWNVQTHDDGVASLIRIPEGHYTLEIVAPQS